MSFFFHALTATIGIIVAISPFLADRFFSHSTDFLLYHHLILGLLLFVISLFLAVSEQGHEHHKTLHALHFFQGLSALSLALIPFIVSLKTTELTLLSLFTGGIITVFSLIQLSFE